MCSELTVECSGDFCDERVDAACGHVDCRGLECPVGSENVTVPTAVSAEQTAFSTEANGP